MLHYSALPYLIAFAALAVVFRSMMRHHVVEKLDFWLRGWLLLLLHFLAQLLSIGEGAWRTGIATVSVLSLVLAGIVFIRAASQIDLLTVKPSSVTTCVVALIAFCTLALWNVTSTVPYYAAIATLAISGIVLSYQVRSKRSLADNIFSFSYILLLPLLLAGLVYQGQMAYGIDATLSWLYLLAGIRYWQRFEQKTTGVLTAAIGFVATSATFLISETIQQSYAPDMEIDTAIRSVPKLVIAFGVLLTFLEEEIEHTEHLALHDPLTGLPNRRLLVDRLGNMLERAERNHLRAAVLMIDLNGFKQINDTYGHAIGDEFLREAAIRLGTQVRKADTLARSGGDEFTVLISDIMQPDGAEILAQKLLEELDRPVAVRDLQLRVSASIGIALYPEDGLTANDLCHKADADMYQAKRDAKSPSSFGEEPDFAPLPPG